MSDGQPDLVIRNGMVLDGTGGEPVLADVAVSDGAIVAIGECAGGRSEIDATGCYVTPGFIDVHTHYDGQLVWGDRLVPSSLHGVTTVIAGNCGVGFAPCRPGDRDMLVSVMEGVEDIPEIVMTTGLDWAWESFPEFLDAIGSRRHDIDFGVYLPHSALRVFVMGRRGAAREPATPGDLDAMTKLAAAALRAGAIGFSTSNVPGHRTGKGEFIPSYEAGEAEYLAIAAAMKETGLGIFQIVPDYRGDGRVRPLADMMKRISLASGRPVTFTLAQFHSHPDAWRELLDAVAEANETPGVSIVPQVYPRPIGVMLGITTSYNPFSLCPSYQPLLDLPVAKRVAALRQPELRARLLVELPADPTNPLLNITRDFDRIYPFRTPDYEPTAGTSVAALASARGVTPEEVAYDLMLERDGGAMMLATLTNYAHRSLDDVAEMLHHPATVIGLGDGGAHYGLVCDASYPTYFLTYWTTGRREAKFAFPEAVKALTSVPARLAGLADRGILAPGLKADINIIDREALSLELPEVVNDLPGGGRRLHQRAQGYRATIVSGEVIVRDGVPTEALPGRLIRGVTRA
ncbi:amidohydrolase family protein [Sphingomonadaceae bacterium G21617-S1]|nr:amidohydrolase family protein [Sphingomonadaceae bacterium G21617-S1]